VYSTPSAAVNKRYLEYSHSSARPRELQRALADFIKECGLPTTFRELKIPENTDFRAIANSTVLTAGCCKKLTHDEIYDILMECK